MNKARAFFALMLFPVAVFSQAATSTEPPSQRITKVIRVHYELPQKIADVLAPGGPVIVTADNTLGVVVLKGKPDEIARTQQTITELDVPPAFSTANDVELIIYLIGASNHSGANSSSDIPAIQSVIKQLGAIFPYKNYELLSTMLLRSQQGKPAQSSGVMNYTLRSEASQHPATYGISYRSASASSDKSKPVIHLENFRFSARMAIATSTVPNTAQYQTVDIGTASDIDLREGQKVVVGKTDVASDGSAIFIVLTAKLVD
jgi:type II secretory pathway component GspD/PulD (secretin)